MPKKQKINLEKVLASLNTSSHVRIFDSAGMRRVDFERIKCPECSEFFVPQKRSGSAQ